MVIGRLSGHFSMKSIEEWYSIDLDWAQALHRYFGSSRTSKIMWELIAHMGDGILWFFMVLPLLLVLQLIQHPFVQQRERKYLIKFFYLCNIVDIVAIIILKLCFKRQRPPHHRTDGRFVGPDQHSFPSGHATRAFCVFGMLSQVIRERPHVIQMAFGGFFHVRTVYSIVSSMIVLICMSRLALGRHYPSDVVAGALIGYFCEYPIAEFLMAKF